MLEIPNADRFVRAKPIQSGFSSDRKYLLETSSGARMLLRISECTQAERKDAEWRMLKRAADLGVPTTTPIERGICDDGKSPYMLLEWREGTDAAVLLPTVSPEEQTAIGKRVGETLRKLHAVPAPEGTEPWGRWFRRKVRGRLDELDAVIGAIAQAQAETSCAEKDMPLIGMDAMPKERSGIPTAPALADVLRLVAYLRENAGLLDDRRQTLMHGDMHTGNLIVSPDGEVAFIDFNAYNREYGNPWWEFCAMGWGEEVNAYYETGLIRGYFGAEPPEGFFSILAYYYAYDAIAAIVSAHTGSEPVTLQNAHRHVANVLDWFDGMRNPIPSWYPSDRS